MQATLNFGANPEDKAYSCNRQLPEEYSSLQSGAGISKTCSCSGENLPDPSF